MIRKATKKDLPEIVKLMQEVIGEVTARDYPADVISAWKENVEDLPERYARGTYFVYEKGNKIVGVGGIIGNHIERVYVKADCQGQGIGKKLMKALEDVAKEAHIDEVELGSTKSAFDFYRSLGYKETGMFHHKDKRTGAELSLTVMKKKLS